MKWGCIEVDALCLEKYLEVSPLGLRLYQKFGFKEIEQLYFDPSKYGGEETCFTTVVMTRSKAAMA